MSDNVYDFYEFDNLSLADFVALLPAELQNPMKKFSFYVQEIDIQGDEFCVTFNGRSKGGCVISHYIYFDCECEDFRSLEVWQEKLLNEYKEFDVNEKTNEICARWGVQSVYIEGLIEDDIADYENNVLRKFVNEVRVAEIDLISAAEAAYEEKSASVDESNSIEDKGFVRD